MQRENEELIPKRPRGRPVRVMGEGALNPVPGARADTPRCRLCEKRDAERSWCPLRAAPNSGLEPMCNYGIVLYRAAKQRQRRDGGSRKEASGSPIPRTGTRTKGTF